MAEARDRLSPSPNELAAAVEAARRHGWESDDLTLAGWITHLAKAAARSEAPGRPPELRDDGRPNTPHEFKNDPETGLCVVCGWAEQVHPGAARSADRRAAGALEDVLRDLEEALSLPPSASTGRCASCGFNAAREARLNRLLYSLLRRRLAFPPPPVLKELTDAEAEERTLHVGGSMGERGSDSAGESCVDRPGNDDAPVARDRTPAALGALDRNVQTKTSVEVADRVALSALVERQLDALEAEMVRIDTIKLAPDWSSERYTLPSLTVFMWLKETRAALRGGTKEPMA